MRWLRRWYGAGPGHLLLMVSGLALSAYVITRIDDQVALSGLVRIFIWFVGALVFHDLILWPLYTLADHRLLRATRRRRAPIVPWINHVRVPIVISGVLLGISLPLVLRLNSSYFRQLSGVSEDPYLWHWLAITGALFVGSAVVYLIRFARAVRARGGH